MISKISTENTFKDRLYKHRNSLKLGSKANSTELPKHFWDMKREAIKKLVMHWSVIDHAKTYQNGSKRCNFCLTEKYHILTSPVNFINKRSALVSKCRHENQFQLVNYMQSHRLISKNKRTVSSNDNMSNFIKNKCISIMQKFEYCLKIVIYGVKLNLSLTLADLIDVLSTLLPYISTLITNIYIIYI